MLGGGPGRGMFDDGGGGSDGKGIFGGGTGGGRPIADMLRLGAINFCWDCVVACSVGATMTGFDCTVGCAVNTGI
jgi:hypothetical protein